MTTQLDAAARHYAAGELDQAARVCLDVIRADSRHFDALHLLGVICTNRGQHADGVAYLLRADAARPGDGRLQANLGSAYGAVQRFNKAVEAYRRADALHHRDSGLLNNLGLALRGLGHEDAAIETFQAALAHDPANDSALFNLARARVASGYFTDAELDFRRLRDRLPRDAPADRVADVVNALARALLEQGRAEDSLAILRETMSHRNDLASVHWHEALVLLLLGRFEEGWPAYESRWHVPGHDDPHRDHQVLDLGRVAGQTVLIREEQGRGDIIQFLRYIRPLAAFGARIRLSVYADLIPLALEMPDVDLVLGSHADETEYDVLTSLLSLPLAFNTRLGTIPAEVPYLRVPASRVGRMKHHLGPPSGSRIGLVWSGSTASQARSAMPASMLEPLLCWPGVEFHCLQKEILATDRAWLDKTGVVTTHEAVLRDFADTAALIESMNLVISIDTAVAHLAGALAKPVWIMLPFNPDWRWLLGRDDSPWYPTARLFRQRTFGDWAGVVRSVTDSLRF